MAKPDLRRGDVVLVAFPFIAEGRVVRKLRPAAVVQSDRYNRARSAVILAAITRTPARDLPCKVAVGMKSAAGRQAGLRSDSVIDCQTVVTIPREEIVRRIGRLPEEILRLVDRGIEDALGVQR